MAEQLISRALAALKQQNFAEARDCVAAFGRKHPLELQHYLIAGLAEMALGEWGPASLTFAAALEKHPKEAQLWANLGLAQENLGDYRHAASCYEQSLALQPGQSEAYGNLANVYSQLGRFQEAESMARQALELGAPRAQALNTLGGILLKQNRPEEGEKILREALALAPNDPLVLSNLANLAVDRLDFAAAWPLFKQARAAGDLPEIRRNEAMARLQSEDYEAGWKLYEARLELPTGLRTRPACPRWRGKNLSGKKLLLLSEQGFGDTIQFCRYGKLAQERGAEICWAVQKPLQKLLAGNVPGEVGNESAPPAADYYIPLLSLPLALGRLRPEEAPKPPYLKAPAGPALPPTGKRRKIGIVWSGSPTNARDFEKAIPLPALAPLWKLPDIQFYAPFLNPRLEELTDQPIIRLDPLIKDFGDTAALLAQLDCLVSVDTATAHLAGAMGLSTIALLAYCPDWRWGTRGEKSAWYPSAVLLRQPKPNDWDSVIAQLVERLARP